MKVIKKGEGIPYDAPKHFKNWSMNKITPDTGTKKFTVGISHFLPGGGAEFSSSPLERAYFCIDGTILVKGKKEEHLIGPGDLIYIGAGEERSFLAQGTEPASILVFMTKVE